MALGTAYERRAHNRVVTQIDVEVLVAGRLRRAKISNLSVSGCRIETSSGFMEAGDAIVLRLPGTIRMTGTVAWREGREGGVEFRTGMHPAIVAHLGFPESAAQPSADLVSQSERLAGHARWRAGVLSNAADVYKFFA